MLGHMMDFPATQRHVVLSEVCEDGLGHLAEERKSTNGPFLHCCSGFYCSQNWCKAETWYFHKPLQGRTCFHILMSSKITLAL